MAARRIGHRTASWANELEANSPSQCHAPFTRRRADHEPVAALKATLVRRTRLDRTPCSFVDSFSSTTRT
jgi:hypothetical protein